GVDDALRERGAKDGHIIRLLEFEFEFIDGSKGGSSAWALPFL
ncbi:DUF1967 domain-containing protein, partial [Bacillus pumilus]